VTERVTKVFRLHTASHDEGDQSLVLIFDILDSGDFIYLVDLGFSLLVYIYVDM